MSRFEQVSQNGISKNDAYETREKLEAIGVAVEIVRRSV